jgi:two-component system response regulator AtoC
MTGFSSVDQAVAAMKAGAYHYVAKPFDVEEIALLVERAHRAARLRRRMRALEAGKVTGIERLVGNSAPMRRTKALLARVARSPASTVLLTGESGTGKDLAARVIHELSGRSDGPFLNVTCSALPPTLLESELFGHERGAFTDAKSRLKGLFEQAHGGTVFLDEIGEIPLEMQAKLLRFLEDKTLRRLGGSVDIRADVRIVAATNVDLQQAVRDGAFREDLYYRLAVLTVELPPLRDRSGDIERLVEHFVARFAREFHKRVERVSEGALAALAAHPWRGNVRELRNVVERAVLLGDRAVLGRSDFPPLDAPEREEVSGVFTLPAAGVSLEAVERSLVVQALDRARGNRTVAASLLGLNRDQIRYRVAKFGLEAAPLDAAAPRAGTGRARVAPERRGPSRGPRG